MLRSTTLQKYF